MKEKPETGASGSGEDCIKENPEVGVAEGVEEEAVEASLELFMKEKEEEEEVEVPEETDSGFIL